MSPTIDELAGETSATVVRVDVEELPQVATRYEVQSMPTFLVFRDGEPVERLIRVQDMSELLQLIN
jgi:thioredoxin 1